MVNRVRAIEWKQSLSGTGIDRLCKLTNSISLYNQLLFLSSSSPSSVFHSLGRQFRQCAYCMTFSVGVTFFSHFAHWNPLRLDLKGSWQISHILQWLELHMLWLPGRIKYLSRLKHSNKCQMLKLFNFEGDFIGFHFKFESKPLANTGLKLNVISRLLW